jgi:hypothetical protein
LTDTMNFIICEVMLLISIFLSLKPIFWKRVLATLGLYYGIACPFQQKNRA